MNSAFRGKPGRMHPLPPTTLRINGVVVDLRSETLRREGGEAIALRPQVFATLRYLIANPNRLVSKGELMQAVWPGDRRHRRQPGAVHPRNSPRPERRPAPGAADGLAAGLPARLPEPDGGGAASIAVLPFASLSDGRDQDYFADGLVEEPDHPALAKIPGLFVIARNSSFAYRGRAMDVRQIADELGVRYLLEGSLQRSGGRLRINGRLVDGASAATVWAGSFDGAAADVFELQDRLTEQIVGVIEPSVRRAEIARARRKPPESLDAYDLYLRALPHVLSNAAGRSDEALRLLDAAIGLDPGYLPAHGCAAWCHEQRYFRGGFDPADRTAALEHADIALGANADDPQAMSIGAFVRANLTRDYDGAVAVLDRALALNGNSALAFGFSALVAAHSERDDRAVEHARKALRLSPLDDPFNYHPYCALALTSLFAGRFDEAVSYASLTIQANPGLQRAPCLSGGRPGEPRQPRGRASRGPPPAGGRAVVHHPRLRPDGPVPAAADARPSSRRSARRSCRKADRRANAPGRGIRGWGACRWRWPCGWTC